MRILHVVTFVDDQMGSGGPLTVALNQCVELRRRGHEAQLLAGWRGEGLPPQVLDGVPAHLLRVGTGGAAAARFTARLTAWVRRNAATYDLVHVHLSRELGPLLTTSLVERAGIPYVVQAHGDLAPAEGGWGRLADHTMTVPALRGAALRLVADLGEREAVAALIGSDEAIGSLPDGVARVTTPERAGTTAPLDVVTVGRLHPDKEMLTFARAATAALELGLDATFSVIGPDGGELAALQELIAGEEHLDGRLRHEGAMTRVQVLERLARADLFVLPAADGARSLALLEALAAGVPSICTSDCRDALTLRARQAALVTRPNEFALAQAIVRLADDPDERAELGRRGRLAAALLFDIGHVVDELEDYYAQALQCSYPVPDDASALAEDAAAAQQVIDLSEPAPAEPIEPLEGTDRMLWVATEVTAHRLALWREVAKLSDLTVALLAPSRSNGRLQLDSAVEPFHVVQLRAEARAGAHGVTVYQPTRSLRTLIRRRPDAVVLDGWESPAFRAAARWARREQIPVVASYRVAGQADATATAESSAAAAAPQRVGRVQRRLLRRADAVLASGAESVSAALGIGVAADRITLLPEQGGGPSPVVDVREGHRFLFLGPLITRTNTDGLIRAFHLAQGLGDVLTIAGAGPMYGQLVELTDQLGLLDSVIFLDELDAEARATALADAHTVVVPSTDEIWGRGVTEAVEAGRHVVVSTACSIAGSVGDLPSVFVADPAPSGLARAMIASRQRWNITQAEKAAAQPLLITLSLPPELARTGSTHHWI